MTEAFADTSFFVAFLSARDVGHDPGAVAEAGVPVRTVDT